MDPRSWGETLVTTQPGDEIAAGEAGRGYLRASHADREQVIDTLKAAFVQGMLTKDELDARVGQALPYGTHIDLAAVAADLPAGLSAAGPTPPARRRPPAKVAAGSGGCLVIAFAAMSAARLADPGNTPGTVPGSWRSRASWWPLPPYSRHCLS
jgi:hypothetical protein